MLVLSTGCGNGEETDRITKELVFNEFNIEQPRGHFAYIEDEVIDTIDEQQEVFAGFASRASGITEAQTCIALNDPDPIYGSGSMTSSTRFTTALHVILNDVLDPFGDLHNQTVKVHFGSKNKIGDVYTGDYAADVPAGDELYYQQEYRFDTAEEEPFLAMRFFQLGMKEWAEKEGGNEIRNKMRTWNFEYDPVDLDNDDGTFLNQGNAEIDGVRINGRDIVVLKAIHPSAGTELFDELPVTGGKFPLNRPGVFFDHVTVAPYDEDQVLPDTALWLEHANNWMDNNNIVRLISRPGYTIQQGETGAESTNDCGGVDWFTGFVGNTLDTKKGSSGGLVIAPNVGEYLPDGTGDYVTQKMVTIGVNHGFKRDPSVPIGPEWGSPEPIEINKNDRIFEEYENWFTGIADPTVPSRDTPGGPERGGAPNSCTEGQAGNSDCIPC